MRETTFWEAIDFSRGAGRRDQAACLYGILMELPEKAILDFGRIQRRKMHQLYTQDVLAAHFILCSYTSDDSFEDFTAWIVAQGKKAFDAVRKSTSSLADILERKDVNRMRWDFTLLAAQAYADKSGKDDYSDRLDAPAPPSIPTRWPDSRKEFEARYPVLYRKFWNQKRMKDLHSTP